MIEPILYKDLKILYVEDEESTRDIITRFLSRRFSYITTAIDGIDGLVKFKEGDFDIVITDIKMPGMSGLEMSQEIKRIDKDMPIIITSAHSDLPFLINAIEIGIDNYVLKPIKIEKLNQAIIKSSQQKLLQQKERHSKMFEYLTFITVGMGHDFNNLLTPALGYISLIRSIIKEDSLLIEYLNKSEESLLKCKDLVQRFMQLSFDITTDREEVDICAMLNGINVNYNNKEIKITYYCSENPLILKCDRRRLYYCFKEIVKNAIEAMSNEGEVTIKAEIYKPDEVHDKILKSDNYVKISFIDTGKGMSKEVIDTLFIPYFTTKNLDSDKGKGLSLALVYSIIKSHGGNIEVFSEVGKGTTVIIYLPLKRS